MHIDIVPRWVRITLGLFALINIVYGIMCYINPGMLFENDKTGVDLTSPAIKMASYMFAARNLAIGLALIIVSLRGVPESIAIVTIIRALIELQTIILAFVTGHLGIGIVVAAIIFLFEVFVVKTMFGVIAKRNATFK